MATTGYYQGVSATSIEGLSEWPGSLHGFGRAEGMAPLPPASFGWLAIILSGCGLVVQVVTTWHKKRFGAWL